MPNGWLRMLCEGVVAAATFSWQVKLLLYEFIFESK